jgi:trk system potassium uptake protein TrkA
MYHIIAGLSGIGKNLAELLAKEGNEVVVVDPDATKCAETAECSDVMVITGDATKKSVLEEAGVKRADALVALTNDDSDNLMICMTGREMGAKKVISLVNDAVHVETFKQAGIDFQVKPHAVVAKHIYRMILQPYVKDFLSFERAEIFAIEVEEGMRCVGKQISELGTPNGMKILVLERAGKYLDEDAKMEPKDWLTLIVDLKSTKRGVDFMNRWFTKG